MKVLIYGDSFVANLEDRIDVIIEANPGATSEYLLKLEKNEIGLSHILSEDKYDAVVLSVGFNDVGNCISRTETLNNIKKLIQIIRSHKIEKIVIVLIKENTDFNLELIESLEDNVIFNEFFTMEFDKTKHEAKDQLHLNTLGRSIFFNSIMSSLANRTVQKISMVMKRIRR